MSVVYVLFGNTGEYSDHVEWVVRAYTSQEHADADCAALNAIAEDARRRDGEDWRATLARRGGVIERLKAHDIGAIMTGATDYFVAAVPVVSTRQITDPA